MKKFFSKIGKGFKKILRGVGKFLNSKVGKIIGTVFMAYSLGKFFTQMFAKGPMAMPGTGEIIEQGGEKATAAAARAAEGVVDKTVVTQGIDAANMVIDKTQYPDALMQRTVDWGGNVTEKSLLDKAKLDSLLDSQGGAFSDNMIKKTVDWGGNVTEENLYDTLVDGLGSIQSNGDLHFKLPDSFKMNVDDAEGLVGKVFGTEVEKSAEGLVVDVVEDTTTKKYSPFSRQELNDIIEGTPSDATNIKLDIAKDSLKDIVALPENPSAHQVTQRNLEIAFDNTRSKTMQDFFADKDIRNLYDTKYADTTRYLDAAVDYGSSEYASLGDAWRGGESLLGKVGNVARQPFDRSIAEITGGKYTGFGSTRSAGGTALTGLSLANQYLAPKPEEPTRPNYLASSVAQNELAKADAWSESVNAQDLVDRVDWNAPSNIYMSQMSNIVNSLGASYLYGADDFNFGHSSLRQV